MKYAIAALVLLSVVIAVAAPPSETPRIQSKSASHDDFVKDMDCSACHTTDGWKLAAVAGKSGFDHDRTGFPLRDAHAQAQCGGCHTSTAKPASTCESCHKDPHAGRMDGACFECHTATAWSDTATLDQHRRTRMPLTGKHALIECSACHKRQGDRQYTDLPVDCYACHRADYHNASTHPAHDGSDPGVAPFSRDCAQCHQTIAWKPAFTDVMTLGRTQHAAFDISTGKHAGAPCASCHVDVKRTSRVRCDGCHATVQHRSGAVPQAAAACLRCHPGCAAR
jgi:hypothetical protein